MAFSRSRVAVASILACSAVIAFAQPMMAPPPPQPRTPAQEAARLQRRGEIDAALALLDKRIAEAPRDVQARFLRGVILTDLKRTAEAIESFAALTREFPELPEPYNNLAVLYAGQGRYDEARRALEQSLTANPNNAVARQNLGDVYVQLAREAWERALAQTPRDRALRAKLAAIGELSKLPAADAAGGSAPTATATPTTASPPTALPPTASPSPTSPQDRNGDRK